MYKKNILQKPSSHSLHVCEKKIECKGIREKGKGLGGWGCVCFADAFTDGISGTKGNNDTIVSLKKMRIRIKI